MNKEKIGFYSVDIIIDKDERPWLIEVNGCNSGFNGFYPAYGNFDLQERLVSAFGDFARNRTIYVVTHLVTNGEMPQGFLDNLISELMFYKGSDKLGLDLDLGTSGAMWNRMRQDKNVSSGSSSIETLFSGNTLFKKVFIDASNPSYVIPVEYFNEKHTFGSFFIKDSIKSKVPAISLSENDILWYRCPSVAFINPAGCIQINPEFPDEAMADNKLFLYELLSKKFKENIPEYIPCGNLCSNSNDIKRFVDGKVNSLFIKKPLVGTKARGIDIMRGIDLDDYALRIKKLEEQTREVLPAELTGVPWLLAAGALSYDLSLVSMLVPSRHVFCRKTKRNHHGCIRALIAAHEDSTGKRDLRYLGAYWRLASMPIDSDALLWERYVGSLSQGSYCEPVQPFELNIVKDFSVSVISEYLDKIRTAPKNRSEFKNYEKNYWINHYFDNSVLLRDNDTQNSFIQSIKKCEKILDAAKDKAEKLGFRNNPLSVLTKEQIVKGNFTYLIAQPERIRLQQPIPDNCHTVSNSD